MVDSTREQYGHWKSLYCTMVTGASRLPHIGSLLEMGMGDSESSQLPGEALEDPLSAVMSPLRILRWSYPYITAMPAMKQRTNPTIATPPLTAPPPPGSLAWTGAFFVSLDMTITFLFLFRK